MRALLIGTNSYAGRRVADYFENKMELIGSYHNNPNQKIKNQLQLDMTDLDGMAKAFADLKPELVIIPAGISSTAALGKDVFGVNAKGASNIIEAAKKTGLEGKIIYFSSDGIFDGVKGWYSESNKPNPINDYGKSKLAAEGFIREHPNHIIMRLPLILGPSEQDDNHDNFITRFARSDERMRVFSDVYRTRIYVKDIPKIIEKLVEKDFVGTINVSSGSLLSYQDMARAMNQNLYPRRMFNVVKCDNPLMPKKLGLNNDLLLEETGYEPMMFDQIVMETFKEMDINMKWEALA